MCATAAPLRRASQQAHGNCFDRLGADRDRRYAAIYNPVRHPQKMQGDYNLWLVAVSYAVAVAACFAALELGGRVVSARGRTVWIWMAAGSVSIGMGIWSMHFIGMLAFHLPIALSYDVGITLFSFAPAVLCAALVLGLVRQGGL